MMDYSTPPAGGSGKMDLAQKDALMSQVKQQIAVANAKELLQVRVKMYNSHFSPILVMPELGPLSP